METKRYLFDNYINYILEAILRQASSDRFAGISINRNSSVKFFFKA